MDPEAGSRSPSGLLRLYRCTAARRGGLLIGRRATTHWSALHLLPYFGAEISGERVTVDGNMVFEAGVTAGLDAAFRVVAELYGVAAAEEIQLSIAYAPEPPFNSGTPPERPRDHSRKRAHRPPRRDPARRRPSRRAA